MIYSITEEFHNAQEYRTQRYRERQLKYKSEDAEKKRNERRYSDRLQHELDPRDNFYFPHDTSDHNSNYGYRPAIDRNKTSALDVKSSPSKRKLKMDDMKKTDMEAHARVDREFSRRNFERDNDPKRSYIPTAIDDKYSKSIAADALARKMRHECGIFAQINFI